MLVDVQQGALALAAVVGGLAAFVVAIGVLHAKVVRPVLHLGRRVSCTIDKVEGALPTLLTIAAEFRQNGGLSLRDTIDRIELSVTLNERRMQALLADAASGAFEATPDGRVTWVSSRWSEIMGVLPSDGVGLGWAEAVHRDDREEVVREWTRAAQQDRQSSLRFRVRRRAGEYVEVQMHARPLRDTRGRTHALLGRVAFVECEGTYPPGCPLVQRPLREVNGG
jgi:PAS domain S-box-containing protein